MPTYPDEDPQTQPYHCRVCEQVSLVHEDPEIVSHWCSLVGGSVPTRGRPRRLLVFINPHGGRGHAPALFYNTILPLFSLAGIETKVGGFTSKEIA